MLLRVKPGDLVMCDGEECVVGKSLSTGQAALRRVSDHEISWVHVATWAARGRLTLIAAAGEHDLSVEAMLDVTVADMTAALEMEAHLNEVMHGVPDPSDLSLAPRSAYASTSKVARREAKAAEFAAADVLKRCSERRKISVRTLERLEVAFLRDGLSALVPRGASRPDLRGRQVDDEVHAAVIGVLEDVVQGSTVAMTVLANRVRRRLEAAEKKVVLAGELSPEKASEKFAVGERTLLRIIEDYDINGVAKGSAKRRRNDANRPDRAARPIAATAPGEVVEIDSTPGNVLVINDDGEVVRLNGSMSLDLATRSLLGRTWVEEGADGTVHADMLARMLRPQRFREDAPASMRLVGSDSLPVKDMLVLDPELQHALAIPFIVPSSITTDRGSDYLSETFRMACEHWGISVRESPPYSPTHKPHIERFNRTVDTSFFQYLPGYIGNRVENRGRSVEKGRLLTTWEFIAAFDEWWVTAYQNMPHEGLRDPRFPGVCLSPNQAYKAMFDVSPDLPVPVNEADYVAMMPVEKRTIRHDGIRIGNRKYDHERLVELIGVKAPTKHGQWDVHQDPYDLSRCWVQHPKTGEWIECLAEAWRRALIFPTSPVTEPGFVEATKQVHDDWARRVAEKYKGHKPLTTKSKGKVSGVTALRQDDKNRPAPTARPAAPVPDGGAFDPEEFGLITNQEDY